MTQLKRFLPVLLALLATLTGPALAEQVHGENSTFAGDGIAMVWGILRGASEQDTQAVLRIAPVGGSFVAISLDGVDPFTQGRETFYPRRPLGNGLDVRMRRATFADFPRREIHLFTASDQPNAPSLTVYFMGLPDTTPEFSTEAALAQYLAETMSRVTDVKGRMP